MTSTEIEAVINEAGEFNTAMSTEFAAFRASLEVAWQLAILNEQIGGVLNSRIAQVRVMVEQGEWPLQVHIQERQR